MKKSWFILLMVILIIGIIIFFVFFPSKMAKNFKIGNNISSQEIVDYILNISSYEATIEIQVESNKNQNKYRLKQRFQDPGISEQEVLEPENISGVKIIKNGNQLKIENTNLSLSSIFENYEGITDNVLDLSCFIEKYKVGNQVNWKEENNQIRMEIEQDDIKRTLWIDRETAKPIKMEAKWTNKNTRIYILYNEVNINSYFH